MNPYLTLVLVWVVWCTLHSALILPAVTRRLNRRFPWLKPRYRLIYNLFAMASLAPVLAVSFSVRGPVLVDWQGPWRILQVAMATTAVVFFAAAARRYDMQQFLGLRQLSDPDNCAALSNDCSLNTGGILKVVRHP